MLIYIISKHFKKDLNLERKQLVICQSIFVSGFVVRVILIFCVNQDKWTDFVRDYPDPNKVKVPLCLPLQFIFYNFLPYMTLIYLHWRNFEPKKVEAEDYDDLTSSSKKGLSEMTKNDEFNVNAKLMISSAAPSSKMLISYAKTTPSQSIRDDLTSHQMSS